MEGIELRTARDRAGLTQEALAEKLGVTLRTVGNWERTSVPDNRVHRVRDVLGDYLEDGQAGVLPLRAVSDVELLAEIARRFSRQRKEGDRNDSSAATNEPDLGPVLKPHFPKVQPWEVDIASREDGPDPRKR